jgi:hypothetical protein
VPLIGKPRRRNMQKGGKDVPFRKIGKNKYKSPSGRTWTTKQVRLYYATKGFTKKPKKPKVKKRKKR